MGYIDFRYIGSEAILITYNQGRINQLAHALAGEPLAYRMPPTGVGILQDKHVCYYTK